MMRVVLGLIGAVFVGCEVFGVYDFLIEQHGSVNYLVFGGCLVAAAAPLCPALSRLLWQSGRPGSAITAYLVFFLCIAIVLGAALNRTGQAVDAAQASREAVLAKVSAAKQRVEHAKTAYEDAKAAAIVECGAKPSDRGAECRKDEAKRDEKWREWQDAVAALGHAPVPVADPLAARISFVTGIKEGKVRLYQPLALPLALFALGTLFLTASASLRTAKQSSPHLPPQEASKSPPSTQNDSLPPDEVPWPALPAPKNVSRFMVEALEQADGDKVSLRELVAAYEKWARKAGEPALEGPQFVKEMARLMKRADLQTESQGGQVYCLGIALRS